MSGRPSRHGRRVVDPHEAVRPARELPWLTDYDPGDGICWSDLVCRHGPGSGDLKDEQIGRFTRGWVAEDGSPLGWVLDRPSRSARQGPRKGRRPGAWTFTCPKCRVPITAQDRTVQAWLDAAWNEGVSPVDLWRLTH